MAPATVDESAQVKALLQRYQAAYERLDARLVHAVWPGVNEAALARAFGGLESQALDFKACYIQLRGATADVLCTGSDSVRPEGGQPRAPRGAAGLELHAAQESERLGDRNRARGAVIDQTAN